MTPRLPVFATPAPPCLPARLPAVVVELWARGALIDPCDLHGWTGACTAKLVHACLGSLSACRPSPQYFSKATSVDLPPRHCRRESLCLLMHIVLCSFCAALIFCTPSCSAAALHYAARAGHTEVAGKLVIAGAHVAAADPRGITAAHLAAERGFAGGPPCLPTCCPAPRRHILGCARLVVPGLLCQPGFACVSSFLRTMCFSHSAQWSGSSSSRSRANCSVHPPSVCGRLAGIVERLLLAGYVVDSMAGPLADGTEGGTALHLAAAEGHEEVRMNAFDLEQLDVQASCSRLSHVCARCRQK